MSGSRKLSIRGLVFSLAVCVFPDVLAQPATPPRHYVIGVDMSFSMAKQERALLDAVGSLVRTGLNGAIQPGDRLSLWAFRQQVQTDLLAEETWTPNTSPAMAERAVSSLRSRRFEGRTDLDRVLVGVQRAAAQSAAFTICLLTDGDTPITGTPFDRSLNLLYRQHGRQLRRSKQPFITTLAALDGKLVAWSVQTDVAAVRVPEVVHAKKAEPKPQIASASPPAPARPSEARPNQEKPGPRPDTLKPPEPAHPLAPSLSPNGGESARRVDEGVVQGGNARGSPSGTSPLEPSDRAAANATQTAAPASPEPSVPVQSSEHSRPGIVQREDSAIQPAPTLKAGGSESLVSRASPGRADPSLASTPDLGALGEEAKGSPKPKAEEPFAREPGPGAKVSGVLSTGLPSAPEPEAPADTPGAQSEAGASVAQAATSLPAASRGYELVLGLGCLAGAVLVLAWALWRRPRVQRSLISRSLDGREH